MSDPVAIAIVTTAGVVLAPILVIMTKKLTGIHDLVNNQLTAAITKNNSLTAEVLQLNRELAMARQLQNETARNAEPPA